MSCMTLVGSYHILPLLLTPLTFPHAGLNYVFMGKEDAEGHGLLSPSSFTLLYKPIHAKTLANLAQKGCWHHRSARLSDCGWSLAM